MSLGTSVGMSFGVSVGTSVGVLTPRRNRWDHIILDVMVCNLFGIILGHMLMSWLKVFSVKQIDCTVFIVKQTNCTATHARKKNASGRY
jgi:hypothetical protein